MTNPTKIVQLLVLTFAVAISQAFRTVPAITVNGIAEEMNAGPAALALFGGQICRVPTPPEFASTRSSNERCRRPPHATVFSRTIAEASRVTSDIAVKTTKPLRQDQRSISQASGVADKSMPPGCKHNRGRNGLQAQAPELSRLKRAARHCLPRPGSMHIAQQTLARSPVWRVDR